MIPPLDPLALPLRGLRLIEASAGTGKTYTIGLLYLRLLLEAGEEVDRLLVVTFTKAATEELRGRIRARVVDALDYLQGGEREDLQLSAILDRLDDREAACKRLQDALARMDEVAVYTIHGFCQRVLMENAFESGAPFEAEFLSDEIALRREIANDLWRGLAATPDPERAEWLRNTIGGPERLLSGLGSSLGRADLRVLPGEQESERFLRQTREELRAFQELWKETRDQVAELLTTTKALNTRSYTRGVIDKALRAGDELAGVRGLPERLSKDAERLSSALLSQWTKAGEETPSHPCFERVDRLLSDLPLAASVQRAVLFSQSRRRLIEELGRRKNERRSLFFDDLLSQLHEALYGEGGERLAETLARRYPIAMIDEFQDTDALQYAIFRRIYEGREDTGLFLIGDPKQAIYGFRGGDIHTYIAARRDIIDAGAAAGQYTLATNWRSSSSLVRAVNSVFQRVDDPFLHAPDIGFQPVASGGLADRQPLRLQGEVAKGLCIWHLPATSAKKDMTADAAGALAAAACAARIAELLRWGQDGRASLGERPLGAGDIAVLVRSHFEAEAIRQALHTRGVTSVTHSRDSVYDSEEAEELQWILQAIAEPGNEGLLRAALATRLLGATAGELAGYIDDEVAWESVGLRFQEYRELWLNRGLMVALQSLLQHEQVGRRLLARADGERRMTNLLQLAELAQVASQTQAGLEGLLRWLQDQRNGKAQGEEHTLRLESDAELVRIVTIHKSKGLEYPIVFLPFPWSIKAGEAKKDASVLFHDPDDGVACLDFGSVDQAVHQQWAQREDLAENLRLLYVAMTRARHHCVLPWGAVANRRLSALSHLLAEHEHADPRAALEALSEVAGDDLNLLDWPEIDSRPLKVDRQPPETLQARHFQRHIDSAWRVSSYSALVAGRDTERPDYDPPEEPREGTETEAVEPIFLLPGGTRMGHCLHELFENLDFPDANGEVLELAVSRQLDRYGFDPKWRPVVAEMVGDVLDCPLNGEDLRLRRVGRADRLVEMEFHFPVDGLTPRGLASLLATHPDYAQAAQGLEFEPLDGLLKGFIDLVFRADGRYFVVDYKSNHLGDGTRYYRPPGLRRAIAEHRYDLQYLLYSVALHRYLSARLPGYDYETHFGGVYYLFLRGMRAGDDRGTGVWPDRPPKELIVDLSRGLGGGA